MIRSLVAGAIVAGMLMTGTALAQGPRAGGPGRGIGPGAGRGMMGGLPLASLNLTQAQQDLIRDIRERHRTDRQSLEGRLREAQAAQRAAVSAIPFNEAQIRAATLALAEVQADLAVQQARVHSEIVAVLTPEQHGRLRTARAQQEQRAAQRRAR